LPPHGREFSRSTGGERHGFGANWPCSAAIDQAVVRGGDLRRPKDDRVPAIAHRCRRAHRRVYATQPVGRIIGWFEVGGVIEGTPSKLWREYSSHGAIDRPSYLTYFHEAKRAFVIIVGQATHLSIPARLEEIEPNLRPPQSFQYLSPAAAAGVLANWTASPRSQAAPQTRNACSSSRSGDHRHQAGAGGRCEAWLSEWSQLRGLVIAPRRGDPASLLDRELGAASHRPALGRLSASARCTNCEPRSAPSDSGSPRALLIERYGSAS